MQKEFERAGLPTALVTTLFNLAEGVGASRIVKANAIPYPLGDPSKSHEGEKALRKSILKEALKALETEVDKPTVFEG